MADPQYNYPQHGRKKGKFLNDPYIAHGRLEYVWHAWGTGKDAPGGFIGKWTDFFWNNNVSPVSQQRLGVNVLNDVDKCKILRGGSSELKYCTTCYKKPICAQFDCTELAEHGAHVYDDTMRTMDPEEDCLIIPTCHKHNKSSTHNDENYPLLSEAAVPEAYKNTPGLKPSEVVIKATGRTRRGMRVKPFTFAWHHTITKAQNPNGIYGGKGQ